MASGLNTRLKWCLGRLGLKSDRQTINRIRSNWWGATQLPTVHDVEAFAKRNPNLFRRGRGRPPSDQHKYRHAVPPKEQTKQEPKAKQPKDKQTPPPKPSTPSCPNPSAHNFDTGAMSKVVSLMNRALHHGTGTEEARTSAVVACKLIRQHHLLKG